MEGKNIKNICIKLQMGTNIMANQVKTPIQNYFEKVLYKNLTFEIPPLWFSYARLVKGYTCRFKSEAFASFASIALRP
jgi:hypothetical protein